MFKQKNIMQTKAKTTTKIDRNKTYNNVERKTNTAICSDVLFCAKLSLGTVIAINYKCKQPQGCEWL